MPFLNELSGTTNPVQTVFSDNLIINEPLDGPTSVEDVMDRFPESIYQQGRDSHLYRLLTALCGDAGAGLAKKQAYAVRLLWEAEFLNFQVLDKIYAANFGFKRLRDETYPELLGNTDSITDKALTTDEWDEVQLADQSYFHRIQDFWTATRYGNSLEGMRLVAQAGTGVVCDLVPHYFYIFDQYSDNPLGLDPSGITTSTSEFVVIPHIYNDSPQVYAVDRQRVWSFSPPVLDDTVRPVPAPTGGDKLSVSMSYTTDPKVYLKPEIEHNAVQLIDRLKATDTFYSFEPEDAQYNILDITTDKVASSTERLRVTRFVTGNNSVDWPPPDNTINAFIEGGVEKESGYYYGSQRETPIVFKTIESILSYTNRAYTDPTFNTPEFYQPVDGTSPLDSYRSDHQGVFIQLLQALYPFLATVSENQTFYSTYAVAVQNTPLNLEGSAIS